VFYVFLVSFLPLYRSHESMRDEKTKFAFLACCELIQSASSDTSVPIAKQMMFKVYIAAIGTS